MTSSLPQGMELWQLCKFIGEAVAVYALFVLMLAAIRAGWALLKRLTCLSRAGRFALQAMPSGSRRHGPLKLRSTSLKNGSHSAPSGGRSERSGGPNSAT